MRRAAILVALCSMALLAGCDGGSDATPTPPATASPTPPAEAPSTVATATSTPSAIATSEATPPSPPGPRRTGDPARDAIIAAVEARDVDALLGMVELQEVACRIEPDMSWHPPCKGDERDGTLVGGIAQTSCEGGIQRDVRSVLGNVVSRVDGFWAAVVANDFFEQRPWGAPDSYLVLRVDAVRIGTPSGSGDLHGDS